MSTITLADLPEGPSASVSNRPIFVDSLIIDQQGDFTITIPAYWDLKNSSVYRLYFVFDLKENFFEGKQYYQIGLLANDSST